MDLTTGLIERLSGTPEGGQFRAWSGLGAVSDNGQQVVFHMVDQIVGGQRYVDPEPLICDLATKRVVAASAGAAHGERSVDAGSRRRSRSGGGMAQPGGVGIASPPDVLLARAPAALGALSWMNVRNAWDLWDAQRAMKWGA